MTTPIPVDSLNDLFHSRPSSIKRVYAAKENGNSRSNSQPSSRPSSRSASRPSSRPSSRPASRPVSPTGSNYMNIVGMDSNDSDQVIPTAIVIKNIPFSVKKDALLSRLASLGVPDAYAFNYHFDNGVFRGLAFANYSTPEETEIVVNKINELEIGGRKLRVEYKKVLLNEASTNKKKDALSSQPNSPLLSERKLPPSSDEDHLDLNDPNVLELYNSLFVFRSDPIRTKLELSNTLSAKERRDAHLIAEKLGLEHYSEGFSSDRRVVIEKRGTASTPIVKLHHKNSRGTLRSSPSRDRLNQLAVGNSNNLDVGGNKRDSYRKSLMNNSITAAETKANSNIVYPIRQPRGPEPELEKNFASRKPKSDENQLADALSHQHIA